MLSCMLPFSDGLLVVVIMVWLKCFAIVFKPHSLVCLGENTSFFGLFHIIITLTMCFSPLQSYRVVLIHKVRSNTEVLLGDICVL